MRACYPMCACVLCNIHFNVHTCTGSSEAMMCYGFTNFPPKEPDVDVEFMVTWDPKKEVLTLKTKGPIPVGTQIVVAFSKDVFPMT